MIVGAVDSKGKASFTPTAVNKALVNLELGFVVVQKQKKVKGINKKGWLLQRVLPLKNEEIDD